MIGLFTQSIINGVAVFIGLYLLLSLMVFMRAKQRAIYALIAGVFSALISYIVFLIIAFAMKP